MTDRPLPRWLQALRLPAHDLLRDPAYRRLWIAVCTTSFGAQITMLALPLTAVLLLQASPSQMGLLMAAEVAPFALLSLPAGVWLDRVRKLPVYLTGKMVFASALISVPLAHWLDVLTMPWLYMVGFVTGCLHTVAGTAAQIVLTQVVAREQLVEAHRKNALATATAEIGGPAVAGGLIRLLGAPLTLLIDALLILASLMLLRRLPVRESPPSRDRTPFLREMRDGLAFVASTPLLVTMAAAVGGYQIALHAAHAVHILVAARSLGLNEQAIGIAHIGVGIGTIGATVIAPRLSHRIGVGPMIAAGIACAALGWTVLALAQPGAAGLWLYGLMLLLHSAGSTLVFVHFLALRQAVTPASLLGRMTSTMRWLIMLGTGPGALIGGWLAERWGLQTSLAAAAGMGALIALWAWKHPVLRAARELPAP